MEDTEDMENMEVLPETSAVVAHDRFVIDIAWIESETQACGGLSPPNVRAGRDVAQLHLWL